MQRTESRRSSQQNQNSITQIAFLGGLGALGG